MYLFNKCIYYIYIFQLYHGGTAPCSGGSIGGGQRVMPPKKPGEFNIIYIFIITEYNFTLYMYTKY